MIVTETIKDSLIAELEDLRRRVTRLENAEAERKHVERLTAAAYGLPTGLPVRKDHNKTRHWNKQGLPPKQRPRPKH